ncbi:unnamed protein product [Pneumocystis jirovecii]|uniref:Uncharacterized protein n=1 Tax=Pneumocystis jirovecii TaxID=42068 RepID=L0PEE9_PNEJI|nr:unnamed protein product [Pneumocystis jirovecii]
MHSIIILSFLLSAGFLASILSCALFSNWYPFFVIVIYTFAPLPNIVCNRILDTNDFTNDTFGSGVQDVGRFITGMLVVSGIALPIMLEHTGIITRYATILKDKDEF